MRGIWYWIAALSLAVVIVGCGGNREQPVASISGQLEPAFNAVTSESLTAHIRTLSSDEFEGRAPGTPGEERTVAYLADQFKRMGLRPGNPDGTYVQSVPLIGFRATPSATFAYGNKRVDLLPKDDFVAVSRRYVPEVTVSDSDVVFVGYGIVAPEYGWDDYKGVDVTGKTIVMLVNDPPIPDAADPTKLDDTMFRGKAMTYYGRWTYKYEIATAKGAAAAIIVHETEPAGYPFEVISGSWGRENFDIRQPDGNAARVAVESWVSLPAATRLFAMAGKDYPALKQEALSKEFRPVALGLKASFRIQNALREVQSKNVVAKLEGSDPVLKDQVVVYSAHWDHLGKDETLAGDQIFNGALDNASGTAALLDLAEGFTRLSTPPKRSILFLAVTGEEKGLLGAKYYAENPLYPLVKTAANINIDGLNQWGKTTDIVVVGLGNSTLDDVLAESARTQDRVLKPDPEPEKGFYYRSDHFEFAKQGVPALYTDSGTEYVGKPETYSTSKREEYTQKDYHKVSDEIKPDWDLSGAVEDTRLLLEVGYRVAQDPKMPEWKQGNEFKAKREEMLRSAAQ